MYVHPFPSLCICLEDCKLPGPACRGPISKQHAYKQAAFDPVIPIDVPESDEDEDVKPTISSKRGKTPVTRGKAKMEDMECDELEDSPKIKAPGHRVSMPRNAKMRAAAKPLFPEPDSDSDSDDSLDDFIVHTDSDEEEKDRIKAARGRGVKAKRSRKYKYENDDEFESDDGETEEDEDEYEKKPFLAREVDEALKKPMTKPLASFLPSTKMLVGVSRLNI